MCFAMCKFQHVRSRQRSNHEKGSVHPNGLELSERFKVWTPPNMSAQKQNAFAMVRMAKDLYRQFKDY
jgi:hypothetical protein